MNHSVLVNNDLLQQLPKRDNLRTITKEEIKYLNQNGIQYYNTNHLYLTEDLIDVNNVITKSKIKIPYEIDCDKITEAVDHLFDFFRQFIDIDYYQNLKEILTEIFETKIKFPENFECKDWIALIQESERGKFSIVVVQINSFVSCGKWNFWLFKIGKNRIGIEVFGNEFFKNTN